ncbi:Uncharacterised protein [uncultured archaeon]|nr:Uncharacterised protein [uncultured archaeon]
MLLREFDHEYKPIDANSPEFKAWFGKSVVKNPDGTPMKVYHGTSAEKDFSSFLAKSKAYFFTPNPKYAYKIATGGILPDIHHYHHRIIPVYLSLQNPFDARKYNKITEEDFFELFKFIGWYGPHLFPFWSLFLEHTKGVRDFLLKHGYDGLIQFEKWTPESTERNKIAYVVFHPWQIKSAISNTGKFSKDNSDITEGKQ